MGHELAHRYAPLTSTRIIVNADDFGLSSSNNTDIVRCFAAGRISSATLVANGDAFEEACDVVRAHGLRNIGVHVNLTNGPPLSPTMHRYCDGDGHMALSPKRLVASRRLLGAIRAEVREQITRVRDAGIDPTHIDSHQHILDSFPYSAAAIEVARDLGIRKMRISRNAFYQRSLVKDIFKTSYNRYVRLRGMTTVRRFTDVKPYLLHIERGGPHLRGPIELMTHPHPVYSVELPSGESSTETALLLSDRFAAFLAGIDLISYANL